MSHRIDTLSVLVLDDHRFMQQILRAILVGLGVGNVVSAFDAEEAARLMGVKEFDLVIAEYRLDGLSGAQFAKLVRASRGGTRFTPIIACTADTRPKVIQELRDAGVDEIMQKPVSSQAVWNRLVAVVNARRPFVDAPDFFGPNRRRQGMPPCAGGDRRRPPQPR